MNVLLNIDIKNLTNWLNVNKISLNVSKTELIIFKHIREFVNADILKSRHYALFESHIRFALIIWGQNISTINRLYILQKRST